ncbi:hypothetical protein SLE2022_159080 [Rubroshorea leprosula]
MLENRSGESCLVSRAFARSCQPETQWSSFMRSFIPNTKRPLELDESHDCRQTKAPKLADSSESPQDSVEQAFGDDKQLMDSDGGSPDSIEQSDAERGDDGLPCFPQDCSAHSEVIESESDNSFQSKYSELLDSVENLRERREQYQDDGNELLGSDGSLPESHEQPSYVSGVDDNQIPDSPREPNKPLDGGGSQRQGGDSASDLDSLIQPIGRDNSITCLLRCSRSDYGSIASLNRSFRNLIRSGDIYKLRRKNGVIEHWVYFSCNLLQWEAFDPIGHRWMRLPQMPHNDCFTFADKESLAVGTELLVFGIAQVIYRYSLLTNSWSTGPRMNVPRCLFGSASLGEIAILAGGSDSQGNVLSCAEMYNSETQEWETLPPMKKPRKMCSGVFMDGKFYVIGGIGGSDSKVLTCGEEYDLERKTWTEIPNMSPGEAREGDMPSAAGAPPLVAVVNNELYAADYAGMEVKKYDKENRSWFTVGSLPERAASMNGWGLAFRACGDRLIVIGGPRTTGGGFIELNSWVPREGPPQWILLDRKESGNFVYNCAVMGC